MKRPTDKDLKRLEQNRKSARNSAAKKKRYVQGLEEKVLDYERMIAQLREENAMLRAKK